MDVWYSMDLPCMINIHEETLYEKTAFSSPRTYQLLIVLGLVVRFMLMFFFILEIDLAWAAVYLCMLSLLLWVHICSCIFVCVCTENIVFISWSLCLSTTLSTTISVPEEEICSIDNPIMVRNFAGSYVLNINQ